MVGNTIEHAQTVSGPDPLVGTARVDMPGNIAIGPREHATQRAPFTLALGFVDDPPKMTGTAVFGGGSAAFGGNGLLYVMGGENKLQQPLAQVMTYNPATGKWAKGPSLPAASAFGGAVELHSGDIVYVGGVTSAGSTTNSVWELATK
jgi:hypothetical protein